MSEPDLSVNIAGLRLRNPVIAASGTFGYGNEYAGLLDVSALGGICTKGLTLRPRAGNRGERLYETPSGLLNSIGLENPGIEAFVEKELPRMKGLGPTVIVNLSGEDIDEYAEGARLLDAAAVGMIELNISCPNVKAGGMAFGLDGEAAAAVTLAVRKAAPHTPLMVKLSPNAPDIAAVARSCAAVGADAFSLINTFKAMAIDTVRRRPVFDNISAGLSGPAVRPIALRMVWELYDILREPVANDKTKFAENTKHMPDVLTLNERVKPIVGVGGITCANDALEFLMAGASAVQVGSATFVRPGVMTEIIAGIKEYMRQNGFTGMAEICIR